MATKPLIRGEDGIVSPPPPIKLNEDGTVSVQSLVSLNQTVAALIKAINSGLSMGSGVNGGQAGNIRNQWLTFVTPSVADTEFEMPHGLDRVPLGFATYFVDKAATIYVSNYGSWTKTRLLLKCDTASTSCVIQLA
jgi:hypothetical protein